MFEGIVFVLRTCCQWKALPAKRYGSASAIVERAQHAGRHGTGDGALAEGGATPRQVGLSRPRPGRADSNEPFAISLNPCVLAETQLICCLHLFNHVRSIDAGNFQTELHLV